MVRWVKYFGLSLNVQDHCLIVDSMDGGNRWSFEGVETPLFCSKMQNCEHFLVVGSEEKLSVL